MARGGPEIRGRATGLVQRRVPAALCAALRPIRARLLGDLEHSSRMPRPTPSGSAPRMRGRLRRERRRPADALLLSPPRSSSPCSTRSSRPAARTAAIESSARSPPLRRQRRWDLSERVAYGQRARARRRRSRLGELDKVLPVFKVSDDPEALTQFIFRCRASRGRGGCAPGLPGTTERRSGQSLSARRPLRAAPGAGGVYAGRHFSVAAGRSDQAARRLVSRRPQLRSPRRRGLAAAAMGPGGPGSPGGSNPHPVFARPRMVHAVHHGETDASPRTAQGWSTESPARSPLRRNGTLPRNRRPSAQQSGIGKPATPAATPPKTFYYTFIVFPPGEFTMGLSPMSRGCSRTRSGDGSGSRAPSRLLDREITFEELIAFDPMYARFMQQFDAKPPDAGSGVHWYDTVDVSAAGWGSRWDWRRVISPMPTRPGWTRTGIHVSQTRRRAGRATGRWSGAAGGFACRRKRSGRWPVERRRCGVRLRRRCKPTRPLWLVHGEQWQACPPAAGASSRPDAVVRPAWKPLGVDARFVRRLRYEGANGSAGTGRGLGPRAPWRLSGRPRGVLPGGEPQLERPDVPHALRGFRLALSPSGGPPEAGQGK